MITEKALLDYLQFLLTDWIHERDTWGIEDRVVQSKLHEMLGCKNMVECLIHKPVNLTRDGIVTTGF